MPWKERYTISDEKSIGDSAIKWPDGKRCCFRVVVDLSPACGPDGIGPADLTTPDAYYGMHGGLDALAGMLDRYDIKATFAVPAVIADIQADKLRRLSGAGHEIAAHGFKHEDVIFADRLLLFAKQITEMIEGEAADACCSLVAVWPSACTPSAAFAASVPTERSSIRAPTTHARSRLFISFSFSFRAFVAPARRPAQGLRARRP